MGNLQVTYPALPEDGPESLFSKLSVWVDSESILKVYTIWQPKSVAREFGAE
jgi:hypothetical protein